MLNDAIFDAAKTLEIINRTLERIGSKNRCVKSPNIPGGCECLCGQKLAYVDDDFILLEELAPSFIAATKSSVKLVHFQEHLSLQDATDQLLAHPQPNVILLDGSLRVKKNQDITGSDLAIVLRSRGYKGQLIGFSSVCDFFDNAEPGLLDAKIHKVWPTPGCILLNLAKHIDTLNSAKR